MPTASSAQRSQPKVVPASTARVGHLRGEHQLLVLLGLLGEEVPATGSELDLHAEALGGEELGGGQAELHLAAGADQHDVGVVHRHERVAAAVQRVPRSVPSRTGRSWRERISAVGPSWATATAQAAAVSLASAGRITRRPGDGPERGDVLDRLVGGPVLADARRSRG